MTKEPIKDLFQRYKLLDLYDDLQNLKTQEEHCIEWLDSGRVAPLINYGLFADFVNELIEKHNFTDVNTYKNEFPNLRSLDFPPFLASTQSGYISITPNEFDKNKEAYRNYIMDYFVDNEIYNSTNFDIFKNRTAAAQSNDWQHYLVVRLNDSRFFPQSSDFELFKEFEDIIFSNDYTESQCFPMSFQQFFVLSGLGCVFGEKVYEEIFTGDLSISIKPVQDFIVKLIQIELDPYQNDESYRRLYSDHMTEKVWNKENGHLGLAKLNAFLQTIPFFKVLGKLQ